MYDDGRNITADRMELRYSESELSAWVVEGPWNIKGVVCMIIYNDLHWFNKVGMNDVSVDDADLLLGDIIDMANVSKDQKEQARELYFRLAKHLSKYVEGNHERVGVIVRWYEEDGYIFAHGDLESDPDRWVKYRDKPWGAGWFKRNILSRLISEFESIIDRKPKLQFLDNAAALAKLQKCHTYVCGHFHPKERITMMHDGIRIIILPRGRNVI
jgi:hypothetical protein